MIESAGKAGITDIEIVKSDGSKIIAVMRTDLDLDADDEVKRLAIADNRTAEPAYCDVVVKRWEKLTRKSAERMGTLEETH